MRMPFRHTGNYWAPMPYMERRNRGLTLGRFTARQTRARRPKQLATSIPMRTNHIRKPAMSASGRSGVYGCATAGSTTGWRSPTRPPGRKQARRIALVNSETHKPARTVREAKEELNPKSGVNQLDGELYENRHEFTFRAPGTRGFRGCRDMPLAWLARFVNRRLGAVFNPIPLFTSR